MLANNACKKWNQLLPFEENRITGKIKGFARKFCAQKMCFRVLCELDLKESLAARTSVMTHHPLWWYRYEQLI